MFKTVRTTVLVVVLTGAALGAAWYHGLTPELPQPVTSVLSNITGGEPTTPPPPFRISATLLSANQRIAHLQLIDASRKPYGPLIAAHEGETVEGYRLDRIDNHRVYFKRDGRWFRLDVGADRIEQDVAPPTAAKPRERSGKFVPPPENIEEIRKDTAVFIEQLKEQPDFKRALEERRRQRQQQTLTAP